MEPYQADSIASRVSIGGQRNLSTDRMETASPAGRVPWGEPQEWKRRTKALLALPENRWSRRNAAEGYKGKFNGLEMEADAARPKMELRFGVRASDSRAAWLRLIHRVR